ncbi:tetratricopeptide repeat protein (macronuclear) [Tetrahymena thermophila SB210]|uniref:Tetratricopeptide repeat protein n=1 Tax=Tetrahymena thermophila (strain SB210) TaxID=312017 RepID=I7MFK3_TETTS|nr:tetratricopeptide repeat protein [Tetrahymena thermophila SB210]EAR84022.2 tetratricopeptide repeat protein [Tetrahymena thermophila SB210]|eukprot:XP_001031685.2 tetratricopeptide repeat protein [Tetrahymena thermophila SB210]
MAQDEVIINNLYRPSTVNSVLQYQQKQAPDLAKLAFKNKQYINSWQPFQHYSKTSTLNIYFLAIEQQIKIFATECSFTILFKPQFLSKCVNISLMYQQNATQIDQLDILGQEILYNLTRLIPFLNTIQYQSRLNISRVVTIPYSQLSVFSNLQGISLTNFANSTLGSKLDSDTCYKGKFVYDPRCRYFYLNSLNHTSIFMNPPRISLASVPSYLSQITCQMVKSYNKYTQKIENSNVQCIEAMLSNIYNYFQNIIQSSKQYYVIDPRTLSIFFNSKNQYNFANMTQADNFYSAELQYLQEQDQAQYIQKFINDTYSQWIFSKENNSYVNMLQMFDLSQQVVVKDYKRNGTTYKIIFNPVIQYDQIPKVITKYTKEQGLQLQNAYLQINIISDEDLKTFTNQLLSFFSNVIIAVQITLAIISIIFLIVAIYYAIQIQKLITLPIIRMKKTLEEINQLKELVDISQVIKQYEQKADIIFLSQETYLLYQSFLDMFEMIQYTSESFFFENEGKTLISLSKKVEFFTKFQNYSAAGVTHNNIGNILLNQEHFFQALEHFSLSVMFAKYEFSTYYQNNPYSSYASLLQEYSYTGYINHQAEVQEQSSRNSSISQKIIYKKTSFSKSRQPSKEKRVSNEIQELNTSGQIQKNESQSCKVSTTKTHFNKQSKKQNQEYKKEQNLTKTQQIFKLKRQSKYSKNVQNAKFSESILKQSEEKHQIQELVLNLFYRQQNYIVTLIAFQESLNSPSSKLNNQNSFNFWKEIKHLIDEQLKLIDYFPEIQYLKVSMNCLISKCYYNQFKYEKTKKKYKEVEIILINLEKMYEQKEKELPTQTENSTLHKEIVFDFRNKTQLQQFNELEYQQQQQDTPKKHISNFMKMKQSQMNTPNHIILDISEKISNTSINIQYSNSENINQDVLKKRISSTKNTSEQKLLLNQSQFLKKIIQNQQNKLLEITQSNNLTINRTNLQTLKQYFQFNRSEYFIFIKNYKKAAEILTELYESSQYMTSNFPFRIVYKLKHIFDSHKIQDLSLLQEYSRFNKNISLQIVISLEVFRIPNLTFVRTFKKCFNQRF